MARRETYSIGKLTITDRINMLGGTYISGGLNPNGGRTYYVDSMNGKAANDGSFGHPLLTITAAVAKAVAGDTIAIYSGSGTAYQFAESVAVTVAGLKFIGLGNGPDQAVWTGLAGHALTFTAAADFLVENIRFRPASGYAGISLAGASSYGIIRGCRFQGTTGSKYGILSDGQQSGVKVQDNDFMYMNAATCYGIYAPIYGTTAENASWEISGNNFHSNTYHLKGNFRYSAIKDNVFSAYGLLSTGASGCSDQMYRFYTCFWFGW